ncbi:DUF6880 family protein [Rhizobium yanglingense]
MRASPQVTTSDYFGQAARLVLDEAERDASFRKRVSAALAARKGPEAIAKLVDRRLGGLERARGFIDRDKARTFRDDLAATVVTISGELGESSPAMAIDRLLRFIATHERVFERIDDSYGHVQDVYHQAIAELGQLTPKAEEEIGLLPERIVEVLGDSSHGYLVDVAHEWTICRRRFCANGMPIWQSFNRSSKRRMRNRKTAMSSRTPRNTGI